jgi:cobalamin biosynthesis protein CbiD
MFARTETAAAARRQIWDVYTTYRRRQLVSVPLPVPATIEQIADEMMKRMGGMTKAIVKKQIGEEIDQLRTDIRNGVLDGKPCAQAGPNLRA